MDLVHPNKVLQFEDFTTNEALEQWQRAEQRHIIKVESVNKIWVDGDAPIPTLADVFTTSFIRVYHAVKMSDL
jgi:hypothetical protein